MEQLQNTFSQIGDEIACVILEPIAGNMNMVQPSAEFVQALRGLTEQHGAVLIYDEVMTGFRVALQAAIKSSNSRAVTTAIPTACW